MKTIKRILVTLTYLLGIYSNICAQDSQSMNYIKDSKLDKFVGTWQWISGDSVLTIVLQKAQYNPRMDDPNDTYSSIHDIIIGWHEFSIKKEVVESSLSARKGYFDNEKKDFAILAARNSTEKNDYLLRIKLFKDFKANDARKGLITMLPNDPNTITMDLHNWMPMREVPVKYTFPGKLVLKRIK